MVREMRPLDYGTEVYDSIPLADSLVSQSLHPYVCYISGRQAISAINWEFTYNAAVSNLTHMRLMNSGSYFDLGFVSSDDKDDTSASGMLHNFKTWGVDKDNYLRVEQVTMDGNVSNSSTNSFFEIGNAWGTVWGTGGKDAEGAIDIGMVGKVTAEALRIPAGANITYSCRVPIPKKWRARILDFTCRGADNALAAPSSAVLVYPNYYDALDSTVDDSTHDQVAFFANSGEQPYNGWKRLYGNDTTYSLLEFCGKRVAVSETWQIGATVVMWATRDCSANKRIMVGDI